MEIDEAKVRRLLDGMTIRAEPVAPEKPQRSRIWARLKTACFITQTIAFWGLAAVIFSGQASIMPTPEVVVERAPQPIKAGQAKALKELVHAVAQCEARHPNAVHKELRQRFGYSSYKTISEDIYLRLKNALQPRVCRM